MMEAQYIVIEGRDGTGTTIQAERLVKRLGRVGIDAAYIREPGSDEFSEGLREILKSDAPREPKAEVFAFNAARVQTIQKIVELMIKGNWIVQDRNKTSTIVYQGYGRQLDVDRVRLLSDYATEGVEPNLELILIANDDVVKDRMAERGNPDYFEKLPEEFHQLVQYGYIREARERKLPIIDANGTIEEVEAQIWQHVEPLLETK